MDGYGANSIWCENWTIEIMKNQSLHDIMGDVLNCGEIYIPPKRKEALEDALKRLEQGFDITHQQSGYWSQVTLQIKSDPF